MNKFKSHFRFNKQERSGIFYLLLVIVLLQLAYFAFNYLPLSNGGSVWEVDQDLQTKIDSLKNRSRELEFQLHPFNPNYITDHKGYSLGMSPAEIDRLLTYRAQGKFVHSAEEFQELTKVSDSLLKVISPYFKFPDWVNVSKKKSLENTSTTKVRSTKKHVEIKDLNGASAQELREVNGIGEKLSARIIKFRDRLGGFLVNEQLYDVYGLEPQVAERVLERFQVLKVPVIRKINVNQASAGEISKLVYISYQVAEDIVRLRTEQGPIKSLEELRNIEKFPSDKIGRIALYLSL